MQFAYYALWIAHRVLQLVVAGLMVQRKLRRKFPVFFVYILSQICIFAVLFPMSTKASYYAFFYTYWLTAAVSLALGAVALAALAVKALPDARRYLKMRSI